MFWLNFFIIGAVWFVILRWTVGRLLYRVDQAKLLQAARLFWLFTTLGLVATGFGSSAGLTELHFMTALVAWAAIACSSELTRRAGIQRAEEQNKMMRRALSQQAHQPQPTKYPPQPLQHQPLPTAKPQYHQVYPPAAQPPELNQQLLSNILVSVEQRAKAEAPHQAHAVHPVVTGQLEPIAAAHVAPPAHAEPQPEPAQYPTAPAPVFQSVNAGPLGGLGRPAGPVFLGSGNLARPPGPVQLSKPTLVASTGFAYQAQLVKSRLSGAAADKPAQQAKL